MRKAIGLQEIHKLSPGDKIWATKVHGFHARCQTVGGVSSVLYYRNYRTAVGACDGTQSAGKTSGKTKTAKKRGVANVRGGKGTASRTVGLLGAIFCYAIRRRMRSDNPVHDVTRFADGKRRRRLSDKEYGALSEAPGLRWPEVDLSRRTATLGDAMEHRLIKPIFVPACCFGRHARRYAEVRCNAQFGRLSA